MKVSILSPVYNEELFLDTMIRSVLNQTFDSWELILVDDGSSDRTVEIAASYARRDPRIVVVSPATKLGKTKAFNEAFRASTGDVILHVGGDDMLPADSLAQRVACIGQAPEGSAAVAFFKIRAFWHDGSNPDLVLPRGKWGSRSGPSITCTRAVAERVFPIPEHLASEDPYWSEAGVAVADQVFHSSAVVCHYRIHARNSTPRSTTFEEMSSSIHARMLAYPAILAREDLHLSARQHQALEARWKAEQYRYARKPWKAALVSHQSLIDRAAVASRSSPFLYRMRERHFRAFTGWRRR